MQKGIRRLEDNPTSCVFEGSRANRKLLAYQVSAFFDRDGLASRHQLVESLERVVDHHSVGKPAKDEKL